MKTLMRCSSGFLFALLLAGCGGDGGAAGQPGPAFCHGGFDGGVGPVSGQLNCGGCTIQQSGAAADGDLFTPAVISTSGAASQVASLRASGSAPFAANGNPGAFVGLDDRGLHSVTINTYLGLVLQETAAGPRLNNADTVGGTGAGRYVFFSAALEFDTVEVILTSSATGTPMTDLIYEICGDGGVQ